MSAVLIGRTNFTDDDGSGTTGTVINAAVKTELYDQIDAMLATVFTSTTVLKSTVVTSALTAVGTLVTLAVSGDMGMATTKKWYLDGVAMNGDTYITERASNTLNFHAGSDSMDLAGTIFSGTTDNNLNLGYSSLRWIAVYAVNGTIQTSDRAKKRDIVTSDLGLDFVMGLRPSEFAYLDMPNERRYGLIAQDVIEAAGGRSLVGIVTGAEGDYGLNYAGLVTPLVSVAQNHESRIAALEAA